MLERTLVAICRECGDTLSAKQCLCRFGQEKKDEILAKIAARQEKRKAKKAARAAEVISNRSKNHHVQ